jgi:hypothetical protein
VMRGGLKKKPRRKNNAFCQLGLSKGGFPLTVSKCLVYSNAD